MPKRSGDPLSSTVDSFYLDRLQHEREQACFLAPIIERIVSERPNGFGLIKCDGQLDPHHCVEQQRIKKAFPAWTPRGVHAGVFRPLKAILADERNIVPVCRRHHDLLTSHAIKLAESDYPPSVHEFAEEYGFYFDPVQGWIAGAA